MIFRIGGQRIDHYNAVSVKLGYDTVASTFGASFYFDPTSEAQRAIFRPGAYLPASIEHEGETLITGTVLSHAFKSSAVREPVAISGYSTPGVLEDCEIPADLYPLQTNRLSLEQIASRLCQRFGVGLVVDPAVKGRVARPYPTTKAGDSQGVKAFLTELAAQAHVVISHDEKGNLLLTEAKTTQAPVFDFTRGMPGYEFSLGFDGQGMHGTASLNKQQTKGRKDGSHKKGNAGKASVVNPYVPANVYRPRSVRQTSSRVVNVEDTVRGMLSEELKGIQLTITMTGWTLGGSLVRPNSIITVTNPDLYLFSKARFFVPEVTLTGDGEAKTATLTCYPPEVFNQAAPKNIFL